jgi:hypothetical protein
MAVVSVWQRLFHMFPHAYFDQTSMPGPVVAPGALTPPLLLFFKTQPLSKTTTKPPYAPSPRPANSWSAGRQRGRRRCRRAQSWCPWTPTHLRCQARCVRWRLTPGSTRCWQRSSSICVLPTRAQRCGLATVFLLSTTCRPHAGHTLVKDCHHTHPQPLLIPLAADFLTSLLRPAVQPGHL